MCGLLQRRTFGLHTEITGDEITTWQGQQWLIQVPI